MRCMFPSMAGVTGLRPRNTTSFRKSAKVCRAVRLDVVSRRGRTLVLHQIGNDIAAPDLVAGSGVHQLFAQAVDQRNITQRKQIGPLQGMHQVHINGPVTDTF